MAKLTKKKTKAKAENQSEDFLQAIKELLEKSLILQAQKIILVLHTYQRFLY